jgi:copper chaperone
MIRISINHYKSYRNSLWRAGRTAYMDRKTISVTGMSCNGCERNVENALQTIEGVTRIDADHEGDVVELVVEDDIAEEDIEAAIEDAGYDVSA